ncbi:hypothetical protein NAEGRDRAFT_81908 [Naegleria gruberi]|uniref:Uncharacterized protein n=1 Tax=Naegleria gruberi TaxID=5762 RepID=D2W0A5_NAEGR|nr:uncharacterized protein NAEGRDRAFT_81908 [Naegleria gruberi]EFC37540.1 hypothetical protein NAEGRDRAFT_81908 [Naegleria gruberi]|eukprot:XP_002670284.1 hypothetical protein NAEGRDRAFT_81908 [Naegleria gruberi strain NEG-M]
MYWCVMAAFLSLENIFYFVLYSLVPFYPEIKVVSLLILVVSNYAPIYVLHQWVIPKLESLNIPYYVNHVFVNHAVTYLTYGIRFIFSKLAKKSAQLNRDNLEQLDSMIGAIDDISYELKKIRKETQRLHQRGSSNSSSGKVLTSTTSSDALRRVSLGIGDLISNSSLISSTTH